MASLACFSTPAIVARTSQQQQHGARFTVSSSSRLSSSSSSSRIAIGMNQKRSVVAMSTPLGDKVQESIKEAEETCAEKPESAECAVAWDNVEEFSAASAHKKIADKEAIQDPLEEFCKDNPETDECKVYDN